jgi:hypothetical protein
MKTQNSILIATVAALAFALVPVTQAEPTQYPLVVTIHSTGNVLRGKTGSFVLNRVGGGLWEPYVNFKVSGTAIPGVDYVALVSPAYMGPPSYGVISLRTLPDPRGPFDRQAYSVVVTLEPGPGYAVGSPSSALIWIYTACVPEACW